MRARAVSRPITWWRLYRGKVWHVGWAGDVAACGKEPVASPEAVGERAPVNARACGDCITSVLHLAALANQAQLGDPRASERGLIGEAGAPLPEITDADVAALVDEWPCGSCGHPNLDHDIDDTCTVNIGLPDVAGEPECPCRQLTRAV